jgi:hypothetical protein
MDDFLKDPDTNATNGPVGEKPKIDFKLIKEKKPKTYMFGLEYHVPPGELQKTIQAIKKSLGTSCVYKETEFGNGYGFSGDMETKVKKFLIERQIVAKDAFR